MSQVTSPYPSSATSTRPTSTAPHSGPFTTPLSQSATRTTGPSPETLDILSALHELLNRTLPPVPGATNRPGAVQPDFPGQQPLDISQLAGEVSSVRARISRARREIEELPDMDRTVEDQEAEMTVLRERIRRQVAIIEGLTNKQTVS